MLLIEGPSTIHLQTFGQSNKKPFVLYAQAFLRSCPNLRVILTMDMTLKLGEALGSRRSSPV